MLLYLILKKIEAEESTEISNDRENDDTGKLIQHDNYNKDMYFKKLLNDCCTCIRS